MQTSSKAEEKTSTKSSVTPRKEYPRPPDKPTPKKEKMSASGSTASVSGSTPESSPTFENYCYKLLDDARADADIQTKPMNIASFMALSVDKKNDYLEKFQKRNSSFPIFTLNHQAVIQSLDSKTTMESYGAFNASTKRLKNHFDNNLCCGSHAFVVHFPEIDETTGRPKKTLRKDRKSVWLFSDHSSVTQEEVAISSWWYNLYSKDLPVFFNAQLNFLKVHTAKELDEIVTEKYTEFIGENPGYANGALYFKILADESVTDSTLVVEFLKNSFTDIKAQSFNDENIYSIVDHIKTAITFFSERETYPEKFEKKIIELLSSTSTPEFNKVFETIKENQQTVLPDELAIDQNKNCNLENIEKWMKLAIYHYKDYSRSGKWEGMGHQANNQAFFGMATERRCFNCGDKNHSVNSCPLPKNEAKINAAKDKFFKKPEDKNDTGGRGRGGRGRGRGGRGRSRGRGRGRGRGGEGGPPYKFRAPEANEGDYRTINGAVHKYNRSTKRWDRQEAANITVQLNNGGTQAPPANTGETAAGPPQGAMTAEAKSQKCKEGLVQLASTLETALNAMSATFD